MQRFKVAVRGRGLWISLDDELEPSSGDLSSQPGFAFYPDPEGGTL